MMMRRLLKMLKSFIDLLQNNETLCILSVVVVFQHKFQHKKKNSFKLGLFKSPFLWHDNISVKSDMVKSCADVKAYVLLIKIIEYWE